MKRASLLFIGLLLVAPSVLADEIDDITKECTDLYPIPERTINSNVESTGHDPRQFLRRRCIANKRKEIMQLRRTERLQDRQNVRLERSQANVSNLRKKTEANVFRNIRQRNKIESELRTAPRNLDPDIFRDSRRSRRSIIQEAEGLDRINAIRRKLRSQNLPDPCLSVGAIRQYNNPCKDYGSYGE